MSTYSFSPGGLPPQSTLHTGRAVFKEAYAVIPRGVLSDIVTSNLPAWNGARFWVLARPMSGFAETFSYYLAEIEVGGGSDAPDPETDVGAVLFVTQGRLTLHFEGANHDLVAGSYAYLSPNLRWRLTNPGPAKAVFHWIRKSYEWVDSTDRPDPFVTHDNQVAAVAMPDTDGRWSTQRFVDPDDIAHDFHVNIVNFEPGGVIPFEETHVMEHGIYVLEGKAVYRLNEDWVEVEEGDFLWLRAFCPQACYAGGPGRFRYLLYKDVNRHMRLR